MRATSSELRVGDSALIIEAVFELTVTVCGEKGCTFPAVFDIMLQDAMDYFFIVYDQDVHQKRIDHNMINLQ